MNGFLDFFKGLMVKGDAPSLIIILTCFLISLILVFVPGIWKISRNVITVAHEGGHALIAKLTFRKVSGIKLNYNTSGVTITKGKQYGLGAILTTMAGYIAPALMALGLSFLLSNGYIRLTLFIVLILLFLMLIMIRSLWGIVIMLPLTAGFYYLFTQVPYLQVFVLMLLTSFLIVGSLKPIIELYIQRQESRDRANDADQLQKLTLIPYHFWILFFLIVSVFADVFAFYFLFRDLF